MSDTPRPNNPYDLMRAAKRAEANGWHELAAERKARAEAIFAARRSIR